MGKAKQRHREIYKPKPEFVERMEKLLGSKQEAEKFFEICKTETPDSIRCNTLKISPEELKQRLEQYGWKIVQPFENNKEIMIIDETNNGGGRKLAPGELGKTQEHLLGYYYVQEISSMLPLFVLQPKPNEIFLDLCASPGSKTTQASAYMENTGLIIANDNNLGRIRILNSNLEKCGVMNAIVTRSDGVKLCNNLLKRSNLKFDKILVDAPCSGEGTLRKSPKTYLMWNLNMVHKLGSIQKRLASSALRLLKVGGEMIYSTCTLTPEEDEEVINYLLERFDIQIEEINLPLKRHCGVCEWDGKKLNQQIKNSCRIYPQDNNTDGFFLAKIKKLSDKEKEIGERRK